MSEIDDIEEIIQAAPITTSLDNVNRKTIIYDDDNQPMSIFRAPFHMKKHREYDFEPKFVSIGPYFNGLPNLSDMELQKPKLAQQLAHKLALENRNIIDDLMVDFKPYVSKVRDHYISHLDSRQEEYEVLKMLALDSCFIIQMLLAVFKKRDTVDLLGFNIKEIRSDMLLLENQIPLFILRRAYDFVSARITPRLPPFRKVLARFIRLDMPWLPKEKDVHLRSAHLLDLYRRYFLSPDLDILIESEARHWRELIAKDLTNHTDTTEAPSDAIANMHLQNASELHHTAGIVFKRRKRADGFGVSFRNGKMKMPCLKIDPNEERLLLNLIAYEHFMHNKYRICTSYVILVDALINTKEDVVLLQKQGVLINKLRSNAIAAAFFNDVGNLCSVDYKENHFSSLIDEVNDYYASTLNRRWANLRQNYCSTPWAVISLIAGSGLLLTSFLQTFYTVYGYYHPRN